MLHKLWTRSRWLRIRVALLAALACTAACLAFSGLLLENTLVNNGNWVSTKESLALKVMGASSFMRRTQGLARCRLNLDAWHGYQEVVAKDRMEYDSADFDFLLVEGAYFAFILDKGRDQFSGIRISANTDLKNVYFVARNDGEFIEQRELAIPDFAFNDWVHFRFHRADSGATLEIGGQPVEVGPIQLPLFCTPGFRGCKEQAAIDNVSFRYHGNLIIEDPFLNSDHFSTYLVLGLIALIIVNLAFYYAHQVTRLQENNLPGTLAVFNAVLAAVAALLVPILLIALDFYPSRQSLNRLESEYLYNHTAWRNDEIRMQAAEPADVPRTTVLFIGSSQTLGAGAAAESETFVSRIQQRLDAEAPGGPRYHCVNAGVNGGMAFTLLYSYRNDWLALAPAIVVLNLGSNDMGLRDIEGQYPSALEDFVTLNSERGIQTLFVLEARSWEENPEALQTHTIMRRVAHAHGIPVIDAHARLRQEKDKGFLWWDFVHPTSFGHRLIADCIFEELRKIPPPAQ